jgi:hypothetical protein
VDDAHPRLESRTQSTIDRVRPRARETLKTASYTKF